MFQNVLFSYFGTPHAFVCHVPHFSRKQSPHETLGNPVVSDPFDRKKRWSEDSNGNHPLSHMDFICKMWISFDFFDCSGQGRLKHTGKSIQITYRPNMSLWASSHVYFIDHAAWNYWATKLILLWLVCDVTFVFPTSPQGPTFEGNLGSGGGFNHFFVWLLHPKLKQFDEPFFQFGNHQSIHPSIH